MSETSGEESNEFTIKQLRNILHHDQIRKHLVQAGYIDERGNVVRTTKDNALPKRPQTSKSRQSAPKSNPRLSSSSTARSNKTKTSARSPIRNQSTVIHNVRLRRAVSPKLLYPEERCLITLKYLGPDLNIEYDREYFEPEGDEIVILQQHCGGENSLVVKRFLKPNETATFYSRRHTNYPFALAFYLNGVIKDRLSVCCESRCQSYTPIGGKRSLIAIVKVEDARPCRRCRYEQRIKKLLETGSSSSRPTQRDFIKLNIERVSKSPKRSLPKPQSSRSSIVDSTPPTPSKPEPKTPPRRSSPETDSSPEPPSNFSHRRSEEGESTPPPAQVSSGSSSPELPARTKKSRPKKVTLTSDPSSRSPRSPSPLGEQSRAKPKKVPTPPTVSSGTPSPEPPVSKRNPPRKAPSPAQVSSGESSPKPSSSSINQRKSAEATTSHLRSSPIQNSTSARRNLNRFADSDEERTPSPPAQNRFSATNNSAHVNNRPNSFHSERNDEEKPAHSPQNKPPTQSFSPPSAENRKKNPPHISSDDGSDGEVVTVSDESNSESNRFSHANYRRNSLSD